MKIPHRVPPDCSPDRTDPAWAERVEREAERHTAAAERAWEKAQQRLEHAVKRAEREGARPKPDRKKVKRLWAIVEERRQELLALQRLAQQSPGGPQRHRPVPDGKTL